MPRDMIDNERSTAIHPGEAVEESVSLSDRFGLWLGFHPCDQATFFAMVEGYADHFGLAVERETLHAEAIEWSMTRGAPVGPRGLAVRTGPRRAARGRARTGRRSL